METNRQTERPILQHIELLSQLKIIPSFEYDSKAKQSCPAYSKNVVMNTIGEYCYLIGNHWSVLNMIMWRKVLRMQAIMKLWQRYNWVWNYLNKSEFETGRKRCRNRTLNLVTSHQTSISRQKAPAVVFYEFKERLTTKKLQSLLSIAYLCTRTLKVTIIKSYIWPKETTYSEVLYFWDRQTEWLYRQIFSKFMPFDFEAL